MLRRLRLLVLASLVVGVVSLVLDKVTEATLATDMAQHLAARMFAPFSAYSYSFQAGAEDRDRILVVDLGRHTLEDFHASWPLSYGQHARVLDRLRQARPQALFMDFQFQAPRPDPTLPRLLDALCAFHADGIPVFLAAGNEAGEGRLRPELEQLRGDDGQPCFSKVAIGYRADPADKTVWSYPLTGAPGGERLPSAALAMADAVRARRGEAPLEVEGEHPVLGLTWGTSPRGDGPNWTAPGSAATVPLHYCRGPAIWDVLPMQAFVGHLLRITPDNRPNCPMHESIEASWLLALKSASENEAQTRQIHGRAVFYGGSMDATDMVQSPLQGDIPGVYLHAQAADNLLHEGDAWLRPELGGRFEWMPEWLLLLLGFTTCAFALLTFKDLLRVGLHRPVSWMRKRRLGWGDRLRRAASRSERLVRRSAMGAVFRGLQPLWHAVWHEVARVFMLIGFFIVGLVVILPMTWVLERGLWASVIGYSNLLVICLLGELVTRSGESIESLEARFEGGGGHRRADEHIPGHLPADSRPHPPHRIPEDTLP